MSAKALLSNLTRAGFKLTLRGDKIRISPGPVPRDVVEAVRANKSALMDCLKNGAINMPGFPVMDGPFTPWCPPLTLEELTAIRAEMLELIGKLAAAEGWPDSHRANVVSVVNRQPLSTLRDDLAHFRARYAALAAVHRAAEGGRSPNSLQNRGRS